MLSKRRSVTSQDAMHFIGAEDAAHATAAARRLNLYGRRIVLGLMTQELEEVDIFLARDLATKTHHMSELGKDTETRMLAVDVTEKFEKSYSKAHKTVVVEVERRVLTDAVQRILPALDRVRVPLLNEAATSLQRMYRGNVVRREVRRVALVRAMVHCSIACQRRVRGKLAQAEVARRRLATLNERAVYLIVKLQRAIRAFLQARDRAVARITEEKEAKRNMAMLAEKTKAAEAAKAAQTSQAAKTSARIAKAQQRRAELLAKKLQYNNACRLQHWAHNILTRKRGMAKVTRDIYNLAVEKGMHDCNTLLMPKAKYYLLRRAHAKQRLRDGPPSRRKKYYGIHPTLKAAPYGPFAKNERLRWNIVAMVRWLQDAFPVWSTHHGKKWLCTEIEKHGGVAAEIDNVDAEKEHDASELEQMAHHGQQKTAKSSFGFTKILFIRCYHGCCFRPTMDRVCRRHKLFPSERQLWNFLYAVNHALWKPDIHREREEEMAMCRDFVLASTTDRRFELQTKQMMAHLKKSAAAAMERVQQAALLSDMESAGGRAIEWPPKGGKAENSANTYSQHPGGPAGEKRTEARVDPALTGDKGDKLRNIAEEEGYYLRWIRSQERCEWCHRIAARTSYGGCGLCHALPGHMRKLNDKPEMVRTNPMVVRSLADINAPLHPFLSHVTWRWMAPMYSKERKRPKRAMYNQCVDTCKAWADRLKASGLGTVGAFAADVAARAARQAIARGAAPGAPTTPAGLPIPATNTDRMSWLQDGCSEVLRTTARTPRSSTPVLSELCARLLDGADCECVGIRRRVRERLAAGRDISSSLSSLAVDTVAGPEMEPWEGLFGACRLLWGEDAGLAPDDTRPSVRVGGASPAGDTPALAVGSGLMAARSRIVPISPIMTNRPSTVGDPMGGASASRSRAVSASPGGRRSPLRAHSPTSPTSAFGRALDEFNHDTEWGAHEEQYDDSDDEETKLKRAEAFRLPERFELPSRGTSTRDDECDWEWVLHALEELPIMSAGQRQHARLLRFVRGDSIFMQNDNTAFPACYWIKEGELSTFVGTGDSRRLLHAHHYPEFVGERSILTGEPRSASVEVTSDECIVLQVAHAAFKALYSARRSHKFRAGIQRVSSKYVFPKKLNPHSFNWTGVIEYIKEHGQSVRFDQGDIIMREGDTAAQSGDCMYFITMGTVEVHVRNVGMVAVLTKPKFFGERVMFDPSLPRTSTCRAQTVVYALKLPRHAFQAYVAGDEAFEAQMKCQRYTDLSKDLTGFGSLAERAGLGKNYVPNRVKAKKKNAAGTALLDQGRDRPPSPGQSLGRQSPSTDASAGAERGASRYELLDAQLDRFPTYHWASARTKRPESEAARRARFRREKEALEQKRVAERAEELRQRRAALRRARQNKSARIQRLRADGRLAQEGAPGAAAAKPNGEEDKDAEEQRSRRADDNAARRREFRPFSLHAFQADSRPRTAPAGALPMR